MYVCTYVHVIHNLMYNLVVIQKMADSNPDADDEDGTTTTGMYVLI